MIVTPTPRSTRDSPTGIRPSAWDSPASFRSRAASTRRCIAAGCGRCGSTRASARAAESNARYRYLLTQGVTGLSVAFDLPTQMGYDSDHPLAAGEVGRVGVAIDSVEDMAALFDGIPLDRVSTSMTINATAIILLSLYIAVARRQGVPACRRSRARSRTTFSRSTSRVAPTSIRLGPRCGSSPTSSRSASASCPTGTRFRSAGITSAKPGRPPSRKSPSRSPTPSRT